MEICFLVYYFIGFVFKEKKSNFFPNTEMYQFI